MSKTVNNKCYFCNKIVKPESSVVFISGAITKSYYEDEYLDVQFLGKRNPRAVIHRECWDSFFEEEVKNKRNKIIEPTKRLKNIID